jgi:hypothetical protein
MRKRNWRQAPFFCQEEGHPVVALDGIIKQVVDFRFSPVTLTFLGEWNIF